MVAVLDRLLLPPNMPDLPELEPPTKWLTLINLLKLRKGLSLLKGEERER